jgi:hypothetical protein
MPSIVAKDRCCSPHLGVLAMAKKFGTPAVDKACAVALEMEVPELAHMASNLTMKMLNGRGSFSLNRDAKGQLGSAP